MTLCLQGYGVRVKARTTITGSILLSFALISGQTLSGIFCGYTQGLNASAERKIAHLLRSAAEVTGQQRNNYKAIYDMSYLY